MLMSKRLAYETIKDAFSIENCQLLTTEQEYEENQMRVKSKYRIVSSCGHETEVCFDSFRSFKTGRNCKACTRLQISAKLKEASLNLNRTEYEGFCIIESRIKHMFDVQKCVEGTRADFGIRPKGMDLDAWLPIQLKTTQKPSKLLRNNYSFSTGKKRNAYSDMLIACVCISDQKIWLFEGCQVPTTRITIGAKQSMYDKNQMTTDEMLVKFLRSAYADGKLNQSMSVLNCPQSPHQQNEQLFRRRRQEKIPGLQFTYPLQEALPYDFIVDGYKVQEKVATICIKPRSNVKWYGINLNKRCGVFYHKGESDYYWINIPDTNLFYLLPEDELIKRHYILLEHDGARNATMVYVNPFNNDIKARSKWMNAYLYEYDKCKDVKSFSELLACRHNVNGGRAGI